MPPATSSARLPWIDNLRTLVIMLVLNVHACVTYSHVGDWYAMSEHEPSLAQKLPFIIWEGLLQSFFMGLLFFISGYFAQGSLTRRGPGAFARERLGRLGLPALFYMLVIHPFILLVLNPWHAQFGPPLAFYAHYLRSGRFLGSSGPLWFAVALLVFCLLLVACRIMRPARPERNGVAPVTAVPSSAGICWFAVGLGLATFLVRIVEPIGKNILNMQLCFFVQYIAFFIAGVQAARSGWLLPLAASHRGRWARWLALVGGPLLMLAVIMAGSRGGAPIEAFFGGWHWQALGYALWEQLAGVGLSLGLLAIFSTQWNRDTAFSRWLAERSFAVYVLHAPVLVALFLFYRPLPQSLLLLPALLTVTGLIVTYALADLARRIPGVRAIL